MAFLVIKFLSWQLSGDWYRDWHSNGYGNVKAALCSFFFYLE